MLALALPSASSAALDHTLLISRQGGEGAAADGNSASPSISANGRLVAFDSRATNLSPAARAGVREIYVRNLASGTVTLVSRAPGRNGAAANRSAFRPRMSANGRFVAFESSATNLSRADRKDVRDVFVRDLRRGRTILVSRKNGRHGRPSNGNSTGPSISGDGSRVTFESPAANLTGADDDHASNKYDVFVRYLRRGRTELVSRASGAHGRAGSASAQATISANGRFVAFDSGASHLTREGNRATLQVYRRDLRRKRTLLVSRASGRRGALPHGTASQPAISATGRYVVFESPTNNFSRAARRVFNLYVRDLRRHTTRLVTRASGRHGRGANAAAECYAISGNGRYVSFETDATNLSREDRHDTVDAFVRDLRAGTTRLVSRADGRRGSAGNSDSGCPSPSFNARAIAFESLATNLSPLDRDGVGDVFVRR